MDDSAYGRAKARVEEKLGFYKHATVYVLVNLFLLGLNLWSGPEYLWVKWPIFGWGIGLFVHAFSVFSPNWGRAQKEKMIQREIEREARAKAGK